MLLELDRRGARGFTIVELLVTIVIVGILASAVLPMAELTVRRNKENELRESLRSIRLALDAYKRAVEDGRIVSRVGESGYPPTLDILVTGVDNAKDPNSGKIYFLRRIPQDPFSEATGGPDKGWGLRSYASSPDEPKSGADVFDVHSMSAGTGLDGIPYRKW